MIRAAVFAIVITLSGAPVVGIVCGMRCEAAAVETHHHPACHDSTANASGPAVSGVHDCNHDVAITPFVTKESNTSPVVIAEAAAPAATLSLYSDARPSFHVAAPPGTSRSSRSAVGAVLRI